MIKTLKISFSLKMTYCMNSILYALKQIPLIKRLLPGSLYGAEGLKAVITILALIWEVISAFLGKFVYLLLMVFLVSGLYGAVPQRDSFLHILFFLTLIGAVMNTYMFNPTKDKYYAILLMRMNAREYTLVNYSYEILKVLVGFLVFGCILGAMVGVPIWVCVLIPFFVAGCKLFVAAWCLRDYEKTGKANNENVLGKFVWIAIALLLAAAYGLPAVGIVIPWQVIAAVMVLALVLGLISIRKIYRFENYRDVYRQIIGDWNIRLDTSKSVVRESNRKLISMDASISSNRKGFEYLNDLFVKRHQKILWRAVKRQAVVCLVLFGVAVAASLIFPVFADGSKELLLSNLPLSVFFMYLLNRGTGFTQALFINCDHSLLTYSFYKQPGAILKLFRIRLREIMKINLLPALVIGCGMALLLFTSGGTDDWLNYVVILVTIPVQSMFFSVHYLVLYYLLQPYNAGTEIKSGTYQLAMWATYFFCYLLIRLEMSTLMFGIVCIALCVAYSAAACALVYHVAPRTFRIRN